MQTLVNPMDGFSRMTRTRILILGGTGEGFRLADALAARAGVDVITSMAGVTEAPKTPAGAIRRGGFGGVSGLQDYLKAERITAVIDATHPFAAQMSRNASSACTAESVPFIHISRPPWQKQPGDQWLDVDSVEDAARAIPAGAGLTFLTTGKTQLPAFAKRDDVPFLARIVGPLTEDERDRGLPAQLSFLYDRGPFDQAAEHELLTSRGIELVVSKNSGGAAAYGKIAAARALGIPVIMVQRPAALEGRSVPDAKGALAWLDTEVLPRQSQLQDVSA